MAWLIADEGFGDRENRIEKGLGLRVNLGKEPIVASPSLLCSYSEVNIVRGQEHLKVVQNPVVARYATDLDTTGILGEE